MFLSKVGWKLSRCLVEVNRVSNRVLYSPEFCSVTNLVVHRRYSDDNDKFVKSDKYKVFKDDDSSVILDVEEERALLDSQSTEEILDFEEIDKFAGFNTSRE